MQAADFKIAFRVDASTEMGTGHLMRCLTLADSLKKRGARTRFTSRHMPTYLRDLTRSKGHDLICFDDIHRTEPEDDLPHSRWLGTSQRTDAMDTVRELSDCEWDWLVVDHYALDRRWETTLRSVASRIMVIDDLADREHECEVLLDQNCLSDVDARYDGKVPAYCRMLLGSRYALLREEFRQTHSRAKPRDGQVKRVLVFFGGMDTGGYTIHAIDALAEIGIEALQVDVVIGAQNPHRLQIETSCNAHGFKCHVQTDQMAELMVRADLAIGAGGSATWERCCLGLPTLTLCVAENQRRLVEDAALNGLIYAPAMRSRGGESIAGHLRAFLDNPLLLQALSRNSLRAVDGIGTERVARAMGCSAIKIREANRGDSDQVFEWRNHPDIRGVSANPDAIDPSVHEKWFATVLADPEKYLLLGEHGKEAVGVVRFDVQDGEAEVSIYLAPGQSGKGYGVELLNAAEVWLIANRPGVVMMRALVLRDNHRSHKLFEASGYRRCRTLYAKKVDGI